MRWPAVMLRSYPKRQYDQGMSFEVRLDIGASSGCAQDTAGLRDTEKLKLEWKGYGGADDGRKMPISCSILHEPGVGVSNMLSNAVLNQNVVSIMTKLDISDA